MTVMRYYNNRIFKIHKEVFKPANSRKVKVVCRLIKKKNIRIAKKCLCKKNLDLLTDAGIEAEDFGGSTVVVRAVPADVPVDDVEDMIVELAAKLADGGRDALREKTEWVLHSIACRAAIKAGDRTNAAEMLALAQRIMDGTVPPFCPHGRPCVLKITRKELEKQFGRLV